IPALRKYKFFLQDELNDEQKSQEIDIAEFNELLLRLADRFYDNENADEVPLLCIETKTADDIVDADATDDELKLFVTNALWVHPRLRSMQAHIERVLGIRRDGK
ncbi:MAG: hypothetical protein ABIG71_00905, partial [Candidatus Uhrbacteria bacterium]